MSISELFTLAAEGVEVRCGLDVLKNQLSDASRRGLGEVIVGRVVVALGGAIAGVGTGVWATDQLRRRALAVALRGVAELCLLHSVTPEELEKALALLE